jgi:uncharacterized protein YjlB
MAINQNPEIKDLPLKEGEVIPNHPRWPVLIYQNAFNLESGLADEIEQAYARNGWGGTWRWGVYTYHHYHGNTHEVLSCVSGEAEILLGGEEGQRVNLTAGDAVVLPAGTGHKNLGSSRDFQVIGAYPGGTEPDMLRDDPAKKAAALDNIKSVAKPAKDPLYGADGPLTQRWQD